MLERFLGGDARAAGWLGQPLDEATAGAARLAERARRLLATPPDPPWDRRKLAAILAEGAEGRAAERAHALAGDDAVAAIAGQQPAVGGGPLYTLVKAAQSCALARSAESVGVRCAPIFWCASEDHDHGEADHADLVLPDGRIDRFSVDLPGRASLRFAPVARWWDGFLARLRDRFGNGPGAAWLAACAPADDSEGLGAWLCRLLTRLFASHGLLCVQPHRLRPLWTSTVRRALDAWPAAELERLRLEITAAGEPDAFGPLPDPPLFRDASDGRVALDRAAARVLLAERLDELSPGAALRPLLQQAAIPCAFFVAGPGELAYHAFLGPCYRALAVPRPLLVPRVSATLLSPTVRAGLARWSVPVECALEAATPTVPAEDTATAAALARLDLALAELEHAGERLAHDARRRLLAAATRLRHDQRALADSLARERRRSAGLPSFGSLVAQLRPRDQPQDRVLSAMQALWQYGPGLGEALVEAVARTEPGRMAILDAAGNRAAPSR